MSGRRGWLLLVVLCGCFLAGAVGVSVAGAAQIEWEQGVGLTTTATLSAQVDPQGVDATCRVQYATVEAFVAEGWVAASTVACSPEDLGAGSVGVLATASVAGLSLNTAYDFRFVIESGGKRVLGATETFTTFGVESFTAGFLDAKAKPYSSVLAGGRPYELTTKIVLNASYLHSGPAAADAALKDVKVALPPGLVGDPHATPRCPQQLEELKQCPGDTQIGTLGVRLIGDANKNRTLTEEEDIIMHPLYNLVPPRGVAARFGALVNLKASAFINAGVRTGSDYGVDANSLEITAFAEVKRVVANIWGEPAAASHDSERVCGTSTPELPETGCAYGGEGKPFLRAPTSCAAALSVGLAVDSYQEPGVFTPAPAASAGLPEVTECGEVPFAPSLGAQLTSGMADSPSGLNVDVHVPQNEEAGGGGTSDLKDAIVRLPEGVSVNPSSASGLRGCSEQQAGFTGFRQLNPVGEPGVLTAQFTPGAAECPLASKLGSVEVDTPLIDHPLEGGLYLAAPHENPFGSLLAVYLAVYDPVTGIVVKLPGLVQSDAVSGQITTTFKQNPQLPFEDLKVSLFSDAKRARLTTPETCGSFTASSVLSPWSGDRPAVPSSQAFQISQEPAGGSCAGSEAQAPDTPGFQADTESPVAGGYSPFVLELSREDGSQRFSALSVGLPEGLVGKVTGLQECSEADIQAAEARGGEGLGAVEQAHPSCPAGSEVGVVYAGAGSGAPFYVTGHAYFAGPYKGAPFSLVIITPALAGPFDLGTVVVRAALQINPSTAQVTIQSDPFPSILDGIPLDIRRIAVDVTRPDFTLNPTSCNPTAITGQSLSTAGQTASLSTRFQVGGCKALKFKPSFKVYTHAGHTRRNGAYLRAVITSGAGQANIGGVLVKLPAKLAVRQSALKGACSEAQYASNPAGCPAASKVGYAIAHTPLLPVPLTGAAIFVSHGGAAFPDLDLLLQGDGVRIQLTGNTSIKHGITISDFNTIPDVPINSFQVTLPPGPQAALAASGNLCTRTITKRVKTTKHHHTTIHHKHATRKRTLLIPTTITAHNGTTLHQNTIITVQNCHPHKPKHKRHRRK